MRVAYLGPPGTVSDEALTAAAPDADAVPLATLRDVVLSVQEGRIERALARSRTRWRAASTRCSTRWRSRRRTSR